MTEPTLFSRHESAGEPLASRMRPRSLDEFLGQDHILGPGKPLRESILRGDVSSIVFWGPPGCGKTTLARLIAKHTDRHFELFSAVTAGVPQVREVVRQAQERLELEGRGTILFCDEIHRFNKAQQDAFLPWVERGVITLIGATTENPSFELNSALLSRMRVFVLEPLGDEEIREIALRAMVEWRGGRGRGESVGNGEQEAGSGAAGSADESLSGESGLPVAGIEEEALAMLVKHADGDARRALNALEAILHTVRPRSPLPPSPLHAGEVGSTRSPLTAPPERQRNEGGTPHPAPPITPDLVQDVLTRRIPMHDKSGESHYNIISALHKAVRGSDVNGALYWLARMIVAGDDPMYIARRVVRMASEDIGLADPRALSIALAAKDTYHFLGSPEGELAIVEAVVYLATAPKSNRIYEAWDGALRAAREYPNEAVPMHIRNAPTRLMKDLGYGKGYRYDHAEDGAFAAGQEYLPEALLGSNWYEPMERGFEKTVKERMEWWGRVKEEAEGRKGGRAEGRKHPAPPRSGGRSDGEVAG